MIDIFLKYLPFLTVIAGCFIWSIRLILSIDRKINTIIVNQQLIKSDVDKHVSEDKTIHEKIQNLVGNLEKKVLVIEATEK